MTLQSSLQFTVTGNYSSALDLATRVSSMIYSKSIELATGTGANQADLSWNDQRTLSASATEDLDLAASLVDAFGTTLTFARVKIFVVYAAAGNTNSVQVTRPASNGVPIFMAAGDGVALRPGAALVLVAPDATGFVVTAGTGDLITFTNSAGSTSVTYDVAIIGASA